MSSQVCIRFVDDDAFERIVMESFEKYPARVSKSKRKR